MFVVFAMLLLYSPNYDWRYYFHELLVEM